MTRRLGTLLVLVVVATSGCGSGSGSGSDGPAAAPSAPAASAPAASVPGEAVTELISVPWRLAGTDGTLLEIRVSGAGCVSFQNVEVTETAKAVTIAAMSVKDVTPGVFCSAELTTEQVPTSLERPLGKRRLVHAPVSKGWTGPDSLGADVR